jgi:hypothetical protein
VTFKLLNTFLFLFPLLVSGQRDNVWIFGDSARLDFNQPGAVNQSRMYANWGSASISDTNGNLMYYTGTWNINGSADAFLFDSNDSVLQNGNAIQNWAGIHFNTFTSYLETDSFIDLFTVSFHPLHSPGFYRTRINHFLNQITIANEPIDTGLYPSDGVQAVRHGNGRDWWVVWKDHDRPNQVQKRNNFRLYLFKSDGSYTQNFQSIGTMSIGGRGRIRFTKDGTRMALVVGSGLIEVYDFDRCSGLISNPVQLKVDSIPYLGVPMTCEFSASGRFLYESHLPDGIAPSQIVQYDLNAPNPSQTRFVVKSWPIPPVGNYTISAGLQRWLDDKIYVGSAEGYNVYPDTFFTPNISNLSRIEDPEQPGTACNFNLNCVYLNGYRHAGGLPNNPNYALKEWAGSGCDTVSLTGIVDSKYSPPQFILSPVPAKDFVTIQMTIPLKTESTLEVYSMSGSQIFIEKLPAHFLRKTMEIDTFKSGLYVVIIRSGNNVISQKFQKL